MKAKEHTRQVRDKVVEKYKAGLGYKKNLPSFEHLTELLFNPSSENGKSMGQLQTYQDMAVHLNWPGKESIHQRSSQEAHGNSGGAAQLRGENLSTGQLLVVSPQICPLWKSDKKKDIGERKT